MIRAPETLAVAFPSQQACPMTGELELSLSAALSPRLSRPERVTGVLTTAFSRIGGLATNAAEVRCLSSASREWLLQRAAVLFWEDCGWFQGQCSACAADFDLPARLADMPRKKAGKAFPVVSVKTSLGQRSFEAPNGHHEEHLARTQGTPDPSRELLVACGLSDRANEDAAKFTPADMRAIEGALTRACPEVADEISTECPECGVQAQVRIDPLTFAFPRAEPLLQDVHLIARAYHWSEGAILDLPSARRRNYARLIRAEQRGGVA